MISVVIPTHNRASMLDETLSHVYEQKDIQVEVIVLNDNEDPDDTDLVVGKYKDIRYIKSKKIDGAIAKRKYGLSIARGEYLYTTDDDDYLIDPYFLCKAKKILDEDSTLSFVSGNTILMYENADASERYMEENKLSISGRQNQWEYLASIHTCKPISIAPTLFRKSAFEKIPQNEILEIGDTCLYLLALLDGDAYIMDDVVSTYRIRTDSVSNNWPYEYVILGLKQRKIVYERAKKFMPNPLNFYANQTISLYVHYKRSCPSYIEKMKVLLWLLANNCGSFKIIKFSIRYILKEIIRP